MVDYVISYDLRETKPDPHPKVLECARKHGLLYVFYGNRYVSRLPNTTLWGVFATRDKALTAFQKTVKEAAEALGVRVVVRKRFVAAFDDWSIFSNVRKEADAKLIGATRFATSANHQDQDALFR